MDYGDGLRIDSIIRTPESRLFGAGGGPGGV